MAGDPVDANIVDITSDPTTMTEENVNAASSLGGGGGLSAQLQLASPKSPPSERTESKYCTCPPAEQKQEQLASEPTKLPGQQGWSHCPCCEKRETDDWEFTVEMTYGCMKEVMGAIGEFRELYTAMEYVKAWCKSKEPKNDDVLKKVAVMKAAKEERLQKYMAEQQAAMAKLNEEKEERLQKFMAEQRVVMAKIIADAVKETEGGRRDSPAE